MRYGELYTKAREWAGYATDENLRALIVARVPASIAYLDVLVERAWDEGHLAGMLEAETNAPRGDS